MKTSKHSSKILRKTPKDKKASNTHTNRRFNIVKMGRFNAAPNKIPVASPTEVEKLSQGSGSSMEEGPEKHIGAGG